MAALGFLKPTEMLLFWATDHLFVSSRDSSLQSFLPAGSYKLLLTEMLVEEELGLGGILNLEAGMR